tara:strand:+ start:375 stop:899 length:525 start_codon:yes stop_codon:yes gene_type:complete
MHPTEIFGTPLWVIHGEVPKGMYEWTREYQRNNLPRKVSNRGGYQSNACDGLDNIPFEYCEILEDKLRFLPRFDFDNWWLNINYKGNYNIVHTHPCTDLAVIWYMTDNHGLLNIRNPLAHTRWKLIEKFNQQHDMSITASAGDIVVFPADIEHSVEEHTLSKPRVCLSFNIKLY